MTLGLRCPDCQSVRLIVVDTRPHGQTVRRRRRCKSCGRNFFTREFPEKILPDRSELDRLFEAEVAP